MTIKLKEKAGGRSRYTYILNRAVKNIGMSNYKKIKNYGATSTKMETDVKIIRKLKQKKSVYDNI